MAKHIRLAECAGLSAAMPLLAASLGLAGLLRLGRALSELLLIFECSGAVGGPPAPGRRGRGGEHER